MVGMFFDFRVVCAVNKRDPPRARATTRARRAQRARRAPASKIAGFRLTWRVLTRADGAGVYCHVFPCTRRSGPSVNSETMAPKSSEGFGALHAGRRPKGGGMGGGETYSACLLDMKSAGRVDLLHKHAKPRRRSSC